MPRDIVKYAAAGAQKIPRQMALTCMDAVFMRRYADECGIYEAIKLAWNCGFEAGTRNAKYRAKAAKRPQERR